MKKFFLLLLWFLLAWGPEFVRADSSPASDAALKIAETYGVTRFNEIEEIRYTFHVRHGTTTVVRKWDWFPKNDHVEFESSTLKHQYLRTFLEVGRKEFNREVDRWFINDQYWLLFPLHLGWDSGTTLSLEENKKFPLSHETGSKLTVQYDPNAGYTPGDAYDLYIGKDNFIHQWVFRKGGSSLPTMTTTWEDISQVGPLKVSLTHKDAKGSFKLWFSDVAIKTADGHWSGPTPLK